MISTTSASPGGGDLTVPTAFLLDPTDLGYLGISQGAELRLLWGWSTAARLNRIRNPNADVAAGNWEVTEKVSTAYVRANIDHNLFGMPLTGNVGMQFVYTDQNSTGFSARQAGLGVSETIAVSGGKDYLEILPSSNFILQGRGRRLRALCGGPHPCPRPHGRHARLAELFVRQR